MPHVLTGLDVVAADPALLAGRRWALLANHAAVTAELDPARLVLAGVAGSAPVRLFAPEHGLDGVAQDMEAVGDDVDPLTGAPVRSLYGRDESTLTPAAADLEGVDVLVVDLPDIGTRHYTFAATMDAAVGACSASGVEVVVLDRPNPIGGTRREGGLPRPGFSSFVSALPTPVRHGLTLGELALLLQRGRHPDLELTVVQCRGWRRNQWWDDTGLPWVPPSPNMPSLDAAALYPGLCLVEATTLSEGRGTTRPFHLVGAPWVDAEALVARLRATDPPGVGVRAARFRPQFGKHASTVCAGVELHVLDRGRLRPLEWGLRLLQQIHDLHPESFSWRTDPYEFVSDVPAMDLLTGSEQARTRIEQGRPLQPLLEDWAREVAAFEGALDGVQLYHEV